MGGPEIGTLDKDIDIANKITTLLGTQGAQGANQDSYAALAAIKAAIPNLTMNPTAGAELTAQLMMMKQRALDRDEHMKLYGKDSNGFLSEAANDFREHNNDGKYATEAKILQDMVRHRPEAVSKLMSGQYSPAAIEHAVKQWYGKGAPAGMYRYFAPGAR